MRATAPSQGTSGERQKAVRILARSLFKDLIQQGYDEKQIVALATELISEVTARIASEQVTAAAASRADTAPVAR